MMLIFTSKNAVYSLKSFNKDWKRLPSTIVPKTTQIIEKLRQEKLLLLALHPMEMISLKN